MRMETNSDQYHNDTGGFVSVTKQRKNSLSNLNDEPTYNRVGGGYANHVAAFEIFEE